MNLKSTNDWLSEFENLYRKNEVKNKIILAASSIYTPAVSAFSKKTSVACALQDISQYEKGAHTGDLGAFQAADYCKYCIVGHSEKNEPKDLVLAKRDACLRAGIIPIVCFVNPKEINEYYKEECLLAWEDPENISKNGVYREKDPQEMAGTFDELKNKIPNSIILYGGSVYRGNVENIARIAQVDGILVGNASLDPGHFMELILAFE